MHHHKAHLYHSHWHLLATVLIIVVPFVFLISFSHFAALERATLLTDLLISAGRLFIAYIIAAVAAWLAAVLFYRGRRAVVALPIFDVLQSFPTFAVLPLATLAWGSSNTTVIFFLVITIIWPLFFSIVSSLKLINREWEEAAQMARLHGFDYIRWFLGPITIPGLITGSIIGLGEGWEALVATEIIVGSQNGIGSFFHAFATNPLITTLGVLGLLSVIFSINKLIWLPLLEWSHRLMGEH